MDGEGLELLIHSVIRQRRFLRTTETSFTPGELESGKRTLRTAVKAARKAKCQLGDEAFLSEINKEAGRSKLAARMSREAKGLSRKHASVMLEHFDLFNEVLEAEGPRPVPKSRTVEERPAQALCKAFDRYYSPTARTYR